VAAEAANRTAFPQHLDWWKLDRSAGTREVAGQVLGGYVVAMIALVLPAITSMPAGPAPLNGMCSRSTLATVLNNSMPRCSEPPTTTTSSSAWPSICADPPMTTTGSVAVWIQSSAWICKPEGSSPRATIALTLAAKAYAFLKGRGYVTPQDVKSIGMDVLRHRVAITYEAEAEEKTSETVIQKIFDELPVP